MHKENIMKGRTEAHGRHESEEYCTRTVEGMVDA